MRVKYRVPRESFVWHLSVFNNFATHAGTLISFGTTSDAGDKFRSRIHTLIETCKKRGLSAMSVLSEIITSVVEKNRTRTFLICSLAPLSHLKSSYLGERLRFI